VAENREKIRKTKSETQISIGIEEIIVNRIHTKGLKIADFRSRCINCFTQSSLRLADSDYNKILCLIAA